MRESCTEFRQFLRRERCVAREKRENTLASISFDEIFEELRLRVLANFLFFFSRDTFQQLALKMRVNISIAFKLMLSHSRAATSRDGEVPA